MSIDYPIHSISCQLLPPLTKDRNVIFTWIGVWLLGLLLFITTFNFGLQGSEGNFSAGGQVILRLLVCTCCGVYGMIYLRRSADELMKFPAAWCLLFAIWAVLTVPMADNLVYAAAACYALFCVTLFVPAAILQLGGRRIVLSIAISMLIYIAASWTTYFFIPSIGRSDFIQPDQSVTYRVGGDAQQLGLHAVWAIAMLLIIGHAKIVRWRMLMPLFALAFITLPFTQSRTSMICAMAICGLYLFRTGKKTVLFAGALGLFAILSGLMFFVFAGFQEVGESQLNSVLQKVSRSGKIEEIYHLTGRIDIWNYVIEKIADAPFFGYGYGCARYACSDYKLGGFNIWELHHAHNLLLNIVLCTGLIGGIFLMMMVGNLILKFFTRPNWFPDFVLIFVLISGITEPVLFGPMPRAHTVIWIIALFWRQMKCSEDLEPKQETTSLPHSSRFTRSHAPAW